MLVRQNLDKHQKHNEESFNYRTFVYLAKDASFIFRMPEDVIVLFLLTIESDKSRFESCWIIGEETVAARGQGPIDFPPGAPKLVRVADKNGGEIRISPL
eukprot:15439316-Alexandrium_andersonii.AAC.1